MLVTSVGGCAAGTAMSDSSKGVDLLTELLQKQRSELTSYAALLRVKISHKGKIDDFRAEVFSRGDSLMSIYVRGFLGNSAFKALLAGDSLLVYFPSEHKYFRGRRHDLEAGELKDSRHIVNYLLALMHGFVIPPDSESWQNNVRDHKRNMQITMDDRPQQCNLRIEVSADRQRFPYQQWKTLELRSTTGKLRVNIQVQSCHFNRGIPDEKFTIDLPPNTALVSSDVLVEMLAGAAP
jgi:hypothetical protein